MGFASGPFRLHAGEVRNGCPISLQTLSEMTVTSAPVSMLRVTNCPSKVSVTAQGSFLPGCSSAPRKASSVVRLLSCLGEDWTPATLAADLHTHCLEVTSLVAHPADGILCRAVSFVMEREFSIPRTSFGVVPGGCAVPFKVWTIVKSGWNVWVWLVGVVSRRRVWLVGEGGICWCG